MFAQKTLFSEALFTSFFNLQSLYFSFFFGDMFEAFLATFLLLLVQAGLSSTFLEMFLAATSHSSVLR